MLKAQELGLNTCWVAMTYKKGKARFAIASGEKVYVVIALGYGENQGIPHKSKDVAEVSNVDAQSPDWFSTGIEAALLAPTAMNQQIIKMREEGTKNFYYFDPDMEAFDLLINTLLEAKWVASALPNRNEK